MSGPLRLPDIPPDLPLDRKAATAIARAAWLSLIMRATVPEIAHAFAPCAIAAGQVATQWQLSVPNILTSGRLVFKLAWVTN